MLPTVALFPQVQPHHHLDHYRAHDALNLPYDVDKTAFPASFPRNDLAKGPFHSIHRPRLQFPHPVQRLNAHDAIDSSKPGPKNPGEHALRRKTPNGTLAAGYDGTPSDATIQPPATKHILVCPLESGQSLASQTGIQLDSWLQPTLDQSSTTAKPMNFPPVFNKNDSNRGNNVFPGDVIQEPNGTGWIRSLNYPPGLDSNQAVPLQPSQQRYFLPNGPYVPTVLPAALQPCIGPTASAGSGPYGPYWPDGAYIPYRPAALRDSRFDSPFGQPGPAFYSMGQPSFSRPSLPLSGHSDPAFLWSQAPRGIVDNNQDPLLKSNFPPRHSSQRSLLENPHNQHILPYHTRQTKPASVNYSSHQLGNEPLAWSGTPGGSSFPGSGVNSRAANAEFKEKILSWAHGVYVDLLATIHQARRNSIASGATADGQNSRLLKPSIYPKPPRQPGLDFSSQSQAPETTRHNSYPSSQYDQQTSKANGMAPLGHLLPVHSTQGFPINRHHERPVPSQFQQHRISDTPMVERLRGIGRFPGSLSASRFSTNLINEGSTSAKAASALEMLSHLCMESNWEWIDGMLLGGCLAYGLGDYHKAMRWYSRIIARDET